MTRREWKYLRKRYMRRKGYFTFHFKEYVYKKYVLPEPKEPIGNFSNFCMLIPLGPFKEYVHVEPYRNLSERRFNLPLRGISIMKGDKKQHIHIENGITIVTNK